MEENNSNDENLNFDIIADLHLREEEEFRDDENFYKQKYDFQENDDDNYNTYEDQLLKFKKTSYKTSLNILKSFDIEEMEISLSHFFEKEESIKLFKRNPVSIKIYSPFYEMTPPYLRYVIEVMYLKKVLKQNVDYEIGKILSWTARSIIKRIGKTSCWIWNGKIKSWGKHRLECINPYVSSIMLGILTIMKKFIYQFIDEYNILETIKRIIEFPDIEEFWENYVSKESRYIFFQNIYEPDFVKLLNNFKFEIPIEEGLMLNLKTLKTRPRLINDFVTFEYPFKSGSIVNLNPIEELVNYIFNQNGDKPDKKYTKMPEYFQYILGYMLLKPKEKIYFFGENQRIKNHLGRIFKNLNFLEKNKKINFHDINWYKDELEDHYIKNLIYDETNKHDFYKQYEYDPGNNIILYFPFNDFETVLEGDIDINLNGCMYSDSDSESDSECAFYFEKNKEKNEKLTKAMFVYMCLGTQKYLKLLERGKNIRDVEPKFFKYLSMPRSYTKNPNRYRSPKLSKFLKWSEDNIIDFYKKYMIKTTYKNDTVDLNELLEIIKEVTGMQADLQEFENVKNIIGANIRNRTADYFSFKELTNVKYVIKQFCDFYLSLTDDKEDAIYKEDLFDFFEKIYPENKIENKQFSRAIEKYRFENYKSVQTEGDKYIKIKCNIEKSCSNCKFKYFLNKYKLCMICDDYLKNKHRVKENRVKTYLEKLGYELIIENKIVQKGCSLYRPDFVIELEFKCILIIEVDEDQHKSRESSCETTRMKQLYHDFGGIRVVFIRYNPDLFLDNLFRKNEPDDEYRLKILSQTIEILKDKIERDEVKYPLTALYLFYNGYDKNNIIKLKEINPYEINSK